MQLLARTHVAWAKKERMHRYADRESVTKKMAKMKEELLGLIRRPRMRHEVSPTLRLSAPELVHSCTGSIHRGRVRVAVSANQTW